MKFDFLGILLIQLISFWSVFIIFKGTLKSKENFLLSNLLLYYIAVFFINFILATPLIDSFPNEIRYGGLSTLLLKPVNIVLYKFIAEFAYKLYKLKSLGLFYLLVVIFLSIFVKSLNISIINLFVFLTLVLFSQVFNFLLEFFFSLFSFWFETVWFLSHLKRVLVSVTGGGRFPLFLLPKLLFTISMFLPFKMLFFVPVSYLLKEKIELKNFALDLLYLTICSVFFYLLSKFLLKIGLKRYEARG